MKCWRCNNELSSGINTCTFCGANQVRTNPESPEGKALRQLYDRYGADILLGNSALLVNGFGDLCPNEYKQKIQLRLIADSGALKMFQEQIKVVGKPTESFNNNMEKFISDSTGLSVTVAKEFVPIFNEMIGWKSADTVQNKMEEDSDRTTEYEEYKQHEQNETQKKQSVTKPKKAWLHLSIAVIAFLWSVYFFFGFIDSIGSGYGTIEVLAFFLTGVCFVIILVVALHKYIQIKKANKNMGIREKQ